MTVAREHDVYYDPYDVDINADPYPTYKRLRDEVPVYHNDRYDVWVLSRHSDVERALVDWQTFPSSRGDILEVVQSGMELPGGVLLWEDPPLHTRHRGLLSRVFTPKRMNALEDQVRAYCAGCLDPFVGEVRLDLVKDLGAQMPMRVIGMLLGIPESDQTTIRDHADKMLRTDPGKPMDVDQARVVRGSLFADYIDWRSEHPSDDLMTALLNAEFEDENGEVRTLTARRFSPTPRWSPGRGTRQLGASSAGWASSWEIIPTSAASSCGTAVSSRTRSRKPSGSSRPIRMWPGTSPGTSSTTGPLFRRVAPCCCSSGRLTGTSGATPTRTTSTSSETRGHT